MSDVLALAMYRARVARKTPQQINITAESEAEIRRLKTEIESLLDKNQDLAIRVRSLTTSQQRLAVELSKARNQGFVSVRRVTLTEIAVAVSEEYGIPIDKIRTEAGARRGATPRQIAMYLCRKISRRGFKFVARFFNRDHSSVCHAFNKIEALRRIEPDLDALLTKIENRFSKREEMLMPSVNSKSEEQCENTSQ